jgi:hypothetical protein
LSCQQLFTLFSVPFFQVSYKMKCGRERQQKKAYHGA